MQMEHCWSSLSRTALLTGGREARNASAMVDGRFGGLESIFWAKWGLSANVAKSVKGICGSVISTWPVFLWCRIVRLLRQTSTLWGKIVHDSTKTYLRRYDHTTSLWLSTLFVIESPIQGRPIYRYLTIKNTQYVYESSQGVSLSGRKGSLRPKRLRAVAKCEETAVLGRRPWSERTATRRTEECTVVVICS